MAIYNEKNKELIQERTKLLIRLEELNAQIKDNTNNIYKTIYEGRKKMTEQTQEQTQTEEKPKLSIKEILERG